MADVKKMKGWRIIKEKMIKQEGGAPPIVKRWRIRAQSNLRRYNQDRLVKEGGPNRPDLLTIIAGMMLEKTATERTEIPGGSTPFTEFAKKKFEQSQKAGSAPSTGAQETVAKSQQIRQQAEAKTPRVAPITGLKKAAEFLKEAMCGMAHGQTKKKPKGMNYIRRKIR